MDGPVVDNISSLHESVISPELDEGLTDVGLTGYDDASFQPNLQASSDDVQLRDEYLLHVKAQVMTRDDSSGGWVPTFGGGMSDVALRATSMSDVDIQYQIHGRRLSDQATVLNCQIKRDLQYVKANPTFHHWLTEGQRFGLTFHSSTDAKLFEKSINSITQTLIQKSSSPSKGDERCEDGLSVLSLDLPIEASSLPPSRTRTPPPGLTQRVHPNRFVASSTYHPLSCPHLNSCRPRPYYMANKQQQEALSSRSQDILRAYFPSNYLESTVNATNIASTVNANVKGDSGPSIPPEGYVHFAKVDATPRNEYEYPALDTVTNNHPLTLDRRTASLCSLELMSTPPQLPRKLKHKKTVGVRKSKQSVELMDVGEKAHCEYCQELYVVGRNVRGQCPDGPDTCLTCIDAVTCMCCARGMLYHCVADDDGHYGVVCSCSPSDQSRRRKWVILTVLAVFLPCLWCYLPLMACHRCGVRKGHCGARHRPT